MRKLKICLLFVLVAGFFSILSASAQTAQPASASAGQKKTIEVVRFGIKEKVAFPETSVDVMMAEIVDELKKLKKFDDVILTNDQPAATVADPNPTGQTGSVTTEAATAVPKASVQLTGTIIKYKPGNRTARYLVGFGAGMTKVLVHIKFIDASTGKVLLEKDMDGKVIIGLFGGDSNGATRGLAKEVAQNAKKIS